ncbi:LANO_0A00210g1_1 [Lachancea nothofagi CBS 11611]|uniref:LANO_0A00210g1_1 n=1 Tax=Lachancea nothofagi CBS 11611 TaxID=1266666 RepID=A0A1G4ILI1_9SACH|nr:LANO_0A00210g1_1 [Lachancea nothofagi CBS 11611]
MSNRSAISSSSSSSSSEGTGERIAETTREPILPKSTGQVKWKGNVKEPNERNEDSNQRNRKNSIDARSGLDRRPGESGGSARSTLSPLTPLKKSTYEDEQRPVRRARPVGLAFSSPNLKALNASPNYEQSRLVDYYHQASTDRGSNYVDPLYRHLNPSVNGNRGKPVWSLNQPLPHVLDQSLAKRVMQKNADAKSRASSKPSSTDVSRSGSTTSINDWRKAFRRVTSSKKLDDIEAQLPNADASNISYKTKLKDEKQSNSHIELGKSGQNRGHHNANFTLGSESYPSSIVEEKPPNPQPDLNMPVPVNPSNGQQAEKAINGDIDDGGVDDDDSDPLTFTNYWAKIRYRMREPFAEFLGTLILVIFGVGGNLQATVTKGSGGSYESLSFAWGFGCMLGVYVAGGISGGHVNPAVTISMAIFRKFPWKKVPVYIVAQIIGAFFGGAMAYGYFWSSITEFEGGPHIRTVATGACLFTNPKPYVTWRNAFFDEFIGTSILVGCLMALLDDSNAPPTNGMTALIVGFLVAAIGMALGYQTSFTINPARDLGPRIFASMIGYGPQAFHFTHWWWAWGTWGGPIAGGITGALVYDVFIFTGCESPINYPDNGYIEHRVKKIMQSEFYHHESRSSPSTEAEGSSNSNSKEISTEINST